jgi:hypothetical protein
VRARLITSQHPATNYRVFLTLTSFICRDIFLTVLALILIFFYTTTNVTTAVERRKEIL